MYREGVWCRARTRVSTKPRRRWTVDRVAVEYDPVAYQLRCTRGRHDELDLEGGLGCKCDAWYGPARGRHDELDLEGGLGCKCDAWYGPAEHGLDDLCITDIADANRQQFEYVEIFVE